MKNLVNFLQELNENDSVVFILSSEFITGNVVTKFNPVLKCIELSSVGISGKIETGNITISTEHIIGWGKK